MMVVQGAGGAGVCLYVKVGGETSVRVFLFVDKGSSRWKKAVFAARCFGRGGLQPPAIGDTSHAHT